MLYHKNRIVKLPMIDSTTRDYNQHSSVGAEHRMLTLIAKSHGESYGLR